MAQLLVTSNQILTRAGYAAKSDSLRKNTGEMSAINRSIKVGLRDGHITLFRANALRQGLSRLQAESAAARGEADKRQLAQRLQSQSFVDINRRLVMAEQRLQQIESKIRSADALKLKASVGYSRRGENSRDITISDDGEVSARFAVAMRLGAYLPRRYELEDIAEAARTDSLSEINRGVLWQAREFSLANRKVLASLHSERTKVKDALDEAQRSARSGATADQPELLESHLKARIDIVRLRSELASVDARIAESGRLGQRLAFKR